MGVGLVRHGRHGGSVEESVVEVESRHGRGGVDVPGPGPGVTRSEKEGTVGHVVDVTEGGVVVPWSTRSPDSPVV